MPVHGGVQIPVVGDLDNDLAALGDLEGRAGNRAVVAQHPHHAVTQPLATGPMSSFRVSPWASSNSTGRPASGNPEGSVGNRSGWSWSLWCCIVSSSATLPSTRPVRSLQVYSARRS